MRKLTILIAFILTPLYFAEAQSKVTFKVNLEPMLKDSTFVPGRDQIQLVGEFFPLGKNRALPMDEGNEIDSIYTTVIRFSSRYAGKELEYNFQIVTPSEIKKEKLPRKIDLRKREIETPPLYFNAFAW